MSRTYGTVAPLCSTEESMEACIEGIALSTRRLDIMENLYSIFPNEANAARVEEAKQDIAFYKDMVVCFQRKLEREQAAQ